MRELARTPPPTSSQGSRRTQTASGIIIQQEWERRGRALHSHVKESKKWLTIRDPSQVGQFLTEFANSATHHKTAAKAYAEHLQSVASLAAKEEVETNSALLEEEAATTYQRMSNHLQEITHEHRSDSAMSTNGDQSVPPQS